MIFRALEYTVPSQLISNEEVLENLYRESAPHLRKSELEQLIKWAQTAFQSTGTQLRYRCAEGEIPFELCADTARRALDRAQLDRRDIDLLIYTGIGRGFIEPASANTFIDLLGLENATGYDLLDACASWVRALDIARLFVESGRYRHVMIVNAEFSTRYSYRYQVQSLAEFAHWYPGITIGEATTATIISASGGRDRFDIDFRTWGDKRNLCFVPLENVAEHMGCDLPDSVELKPLQFISFGMPLLYFGATKLIVQYRELDRFHCDTARIFGHAASDGMSRHVLQQCDIDPQRFAFMHQRFGNTVSASVPLAMAVAREEGGLSHGDEVLLLVASAGVTTSLCRFVFLTSEPKMQPKGVGHAAVQL
jgi:3-oxoacyl-[acyl-carrier-protein] synthase III